MAVLKTAHVGGNKEELYQFTNGVEHDRRLVKQEVRSQKAWCVQLCNLGLLSTQEKDLACSLLNEAEKQILAGAFTWNIADEDIHMNLEAFVTARAGDLGKKIHIGRSRNDLIATTLRLYVADQAELFHKALSGITDVYRKLAGEHEELVIPGQSHMQFGQPIRLSHILLGSVQALSRDQKRLQNTQEEALSVLPLGAAAFAGTTIDLNLEALADDLGFAEVCQNSYDSVGDRDFLLQMQDTIATLMTHLSQQCQDFIYWASTPVGLLELPAAWSTGSSIMPNKRNPDVPELIRAKASRSIARASAAKSTVKGLCTSYSSDLHEVKKDLIDACEELHQVLHVFTQFISAMRFRPEVAPDLLAKGHVLATEVAGLLVENGIPFRQAYQITAQLVEKADAVGVQVQELEPQHMKEVDGLKGELHSAIHALTPQAAVEKRQAPGGTCLENVQKAQQQGRLNVASA